MTAPQQPGERHRETASEVVLNTVTHRGCDCDAVIDRFAAALAAAEAEGAARPCPTCVREGGPYRCCQHCADDAIHDVPRDGHGLPCSLCIRQEGAARYEALRAGVEALARELTDHVGHAVAEAHEWEGDPHRVAEWEGKASAYAWSTNRLRALLGADGDTGSGT